MTRFALNRAQSLLDRRSLLAGAGALAASSVVTRAAEPAALPAVPAAMPAGAAGTSLVLLGTTGAPYFIPGRKMCGQAIVIDSRVYVIDVGYGVVGQMAQAKLAFGNVAGIFLTHMHADHMADYPMLVYEIGFGHGIDPVAVRGPEGVNQTHAGALGVFSGALASRAAMMQGMTPLDRRFALTQLSRNGVIYEDDHVKVTALKVPHPPIPSYAYRFDSRDRSIVISGDTSYFEPLAALAKDADILVHEAIYLPGFAGPPYNMPDTMVKMATTVHTTPEQAGQIAQRAGVKTLVLSHLIPGESTTTDDIWRAEAAKHYGGKIIVGHDLMII